ncbi:hypothetical protein [Streptomyces purpurogeneiscleroticus]|uniref:hypothetical protein n=1 Tax=Streptomyces purpurogeneiscleroticus TaxID=68259 RepID=UPI001CC1B018|nr:hypothetical protein [Streptomyces purpurogeneiscleroticus]MBZ4017092.1 hypothetical protein [Streptomyces purpurogeneiscleroticus]
MTADRNEQTGKGTSDNGADVRSGVLGTGPFVPRTPWWHRWHWRRLMRGRLRPALAAGLAGVLLGGTAVAWQTDAGPFAGARRACWSALDSADVAALFGGSEDIGSESVGSEDVGSEDIDSVDTPLDSDPIGSEGPSGQCVLRSSSGNRVTVQVHKLDTRFGGAGGQWADEFLSARLTPLGGGLLGMASDTRAWLAVPDGCAGRSRTGDGPLVIDVATGWTVYDDVVDGTERDRLARTVVKLVNHYMAGQGCEGTLADPVPRLPRPTRFLDEQPDAFCGIKGLRTSGKEWTAAYRPMVTRGPGPVRTCDRDVSFDHPALRLMTIEDPRLAVLYHRQALQDGRRIESADPEDGHGFYHPGFALFQADCQTGEVTFLARADDASHAYIIRDLFPRYVTKEAARLGCGPLHITLPPDPAR